MVFFKVIIDGYRFKNIYRPIEYGTQFPFSFAQMQIIDGIVHIEGRSVFEFHEENGIMSALIDAEIPKDSIFIIWGN